MPGKYIVVFKDQVTQDQIDEYANEVTANGGSVSDRYYSFLKGFAATIPDQFLHSLQSLHNDVLDYIEPDGTVRIQQK